MPRRLPRQAPAQPALAFAQPAAQPAAQTAPDPDALGSVERLYGWPDGPLLIGADEAGRGPLAGPVVAAAVCLRPGAPLPPELDDSKRLTDRSRARCFDALPAASLAAAVAFVDAAEIDRVNILQASLGAMFLAAQAVLASLRAQGHLPPDGVLDVLVDGKQHLPGPWRARPFVGGDHRSLHIAAASIFAKVSRDLWMTDAEARFPGYGFAVHKGYPTGQHRAAVAALGPCALHRLTFRGVREHAPTPPPLPAGGAPLTSVRGRVTARYPALITP